MRTLIDALPYAYAPDRQPYQEMITWRCSWIAAPESGSPQRVTAFRKAFRVEQAFTLRAHVSADERYELFLDGERLGRGPERGDANLWFFETYDLPLTPGEHVLAARAWTAGTAAPLAQITLRQGKNPAFLFSPQEPEWIERLGTGVSAWECKPVEGISFFRHGISHYCATGDNLLLDGARFPWGWEHGAGDGWVAAAAVEPAVSAYPGHNQHGGHLLTPALLPAMLDKPRQAGQARCVLASLEGAVTLSASLAEEQAAWNRMLAGGGNLVIPPHTQRRAILDLDNYFCAYHHLQASGGSGAKVRIHWAEALFNEPEARTKGNRSEIEGKYFLGKGDTFLLEGGAGRRYEPLWWQAGRYLEVLVETADDPLTIAGLSLSETRYPLEMESAFQASDPRLEQVIPLAVRALQMCSHETYMDCPYYEQLMYVGDTRLEALTTLALTRDDRLPRKALRMFDASRMISGLTQSRYPCRELQVIPPFALWWVGMVYDYALWRGDPAFIRSLAPGVRSVLDGYLRFLNPQGLVQAPRGWNFMDWVPAWKAGIPPEGEFGVNGLLNWQFVLALGMGAALESWLGETELAGRWWRLAVEQAARAKAAFWHEDRHLFAEDLAGQHFSEHTQCLALLSGQLSLHEQAEVSASLVSAPGLYPTTIYFRHYLFEALYAAGRGDLIPEHMRLWFDHPALGMKTTLEAPEPSRSDCHAWGAHPLYHYYASILGIRPAEMGFRSVRIAPALGGLDAAAGVLPHPQGWIEVTLHREGGRLHGRINLPEGVSGVFLDGRLTTALHPGAQEIGTAE